MSVPRGRSPGTRGRHDRTLALQQCAADRARWYAVLHLVYAGLTSRYANPVRVHRCHAPVRRTLAPQHRAPCRTVPEPCMCATPTCTQRTRSRTACPRTCTACTDRCTACTGSCTACTRTCTACARTRTAPTCTGQTCTMSNDVPTTYIVAVDGTLLWQHAGGVHANPGAVRAALRTALP